MAAADVPAYGWAIIGIGAFIILFVAVHLLTRAPYFDLANKMIVVTGGSSGIGKAAAKVCCFLSLRCDASHIWTSAALLPFCMQEALARGASVAILARKQATLDGTNSDD
jgi:hypothetical protein